MANIIVSSTIHQIMQAANAAAARTILAAAGTGDANTFTILNKFTGGVEAHRGHTQGVVIGQMSPNTLTDASDSVRIGYGANESAASASTSSVFVGRHSGSHCVGNNSVFVGHAPGQYAYDSSNAVMIGYLAGRNPGQNASYHGFSSVLIGHEAGTNGVSNQTAVMIGAQCGKGSSAAVGSVLIGYGAGAVATTTTNAVIIGYTAGSGATNATRAVLIGNEAGYGLASAADLLIIESNTSYRNTGLIAGNFSTAERSVALNVTKLGLYGNAPVTKPTVTGSRGGNAALASLLTALSNIGLLTDSSS